MQNKIALKVVQNGEITMKDCRVPEANRADKEAPWADWKKGKVEGLSATKLSGILRPYKVRSMRLKRGGPHGYTLESLLTVFERYLTDPL
jgi:hypothetical protein